MPAKHAGAVEAALLRLKDFQRMENEKETEEAQKRSTRRTGCERNGGPEGPIEQWDGRRSSGRTLVQLGHPQGRNCTEKAPYDQSPKVLFYEKSGAPAKGVRL